MTKRELEVFKSLLNFTTTSAQILLDEDLVMKDDDDYVDMLETVEEAQEIVEKNEQEVQEDEDE